MYNDNETVRSLRTRISRPERDNEYWTEEERQQLEEAFYAGEGITEIALRHKRSELAVVQQIEKMDLYDAGTFDADSLHRAGGRRSTGHGV